MRFFSPPLYGPLGSWAGRCTSPQSLWLSRRRAGLRPAPPSSCCPPPRNSDRKYVQKKEGQSTNSRCRIRSRPSCSHQYDRVVRPLQFADGHVLPDVDIAIETTAGMFGCLSKSIDDILEDKKKKKERYIY